MKSWKKSLTRLLAVGFALSLAACGTTGGTTPATDAGNGGTSDNGGGGGDGSGYKIATVPKVQGISWFQRMNEGVDQFNADFGDEVDAWQVGPDTEDAAKQVQIIEDLIAQNVDAIIVVPNDPQAVAPALAKARERGIVVITHEAPGLVGTDSIDYDLESFDNAVFGQKMFEKLAEGMGGSGQFVGMVGSLTSETHMAWYNSGMEWLKENYPDITPVTDNPYEDNNDDATARSNALEILNAYPNITGYVNCSVSANANMAAVLQEKQIKTVTMSGLSLPSVAGPYLQDEVMYSAQTWDPAGAGYAANVLALMVLKGEEITSGIDLKYDGYGDVQVDGQLLIADAILMLHKDQFPDNKYPF